MLLCLYVCLQEHAMNLSLFVHPPNRYLRETRGDDKPLQVAPNPFAQGMHTS